MIEIRISAVGNECFPKNPYKNTLYYICLNPQAQSNSILVPVSCLWLPFYQESPRDVSAANSLILVTGKPISTNQASDIKPICCGDVTRCHLQNWRRRRLDLLRFLIRMRIVSKNRYDKMYFCDD